MRLIDADKVKIESRKHCINCNLNGTKQCKTCVINLICDRLDLQPTAEERPRGMWVYETKLDGVGNWYCSNCYEDKQWIGKNSDFCPYCGADMREGVNNGKK